MLFRNGGEHHGSQTSHLAAAAAVLVVASLGTTTMPASAEAPAAGKAVGTPAVEKVWPAAPCAHPLPHDEVQAVVWDEIARLYGLGLPACDLVWSFGALPDGLWGVAYPTTDVDDRILVVIDPDPDVYGEQLEQGVRTTVRHELGHALTYMAGFDDASLRATFDAELAGVHLDADTNLGFEASAEAIAQALTPPDEKRTWFYDEVVEDEDLYAARYLLDTYWLRDASTTP